MSELQNTEGKKRRGSQQVKKRVVSDEILFCIPFICSLQRTFPLAEELGRLRHAPMRVAPAPNEQHLTTPRALDPAEYKFEKNVRIQSITSDDPKNDSSSG